MNQIIVKDESAAGQLLREITLSFQEEYITLKELIEGRVKAEVDRFNASGSHRFNGLVQPNGAEVVLNGYELDRHRKLDAEKQSLIALDAFQKNGFFVIVDDQQVDELEARITVQPDTSVSFIKLTPLVGG
ncbi:MAG: hypothetical protein AAFV80_03705 [Bacteroidota bacterium]